MSAPGAPQLRPAAPSAGRPWLRRVVTLLVAAAIAVAAVRIVGRVDWAGVWAAFGYLAWWQPLALAAVLLLRQVLNASPLSFFIPGVSLVKATLNDQGAILMSAVAPPPSDLALRVAMFNTWGVGASTALAGTVMNTLIFYIVRFSAPVLGFALLFVTGRPLSWRWVDAGFVAVAVAIIVGLGLVVRSEGVARTVGTRAGQLAVVLRRPIDPQRWGQACADFRADIVQRLPSGMPRSLLGLWGMLAVDLTLLTLCLRFVGVSAGEVGLVDIAIAYLFAYPFTLFPFSGLGVVDALVIAALVMVAGNQVEAPALAALVVWRVFTVGAPILLGVGAVAYWRRSHARSLTPGEAVG